MSVPAIARARANKQNEFNDCMSVPPTHRRTATGIALLLGLAVSLSACGQNDGGQDEAATDASTATTTSASTDQQVGTTAAGSLPTPAPADSTAPSTTSASAGTEVEPSTNAPPPGLDCTISCNLVMEGDSLTVSLNDWLCTEVGTLNCVNSGVVAQRIDQMVETARVDVDDQLGTGNNDVLILWAGTNDLWQKFHSPDPTENAEITYGWIETYIDERREQGWDYIFVLTHPPMNPDIIEGADRLNTLIRANSAGADSVIDIAAEPRLADPFDLVLRAVDGVHYTDPGGFIVVFDYIVPAIRGLDGT